MSEYFNVIHPETGQQIFTSRKTFNNQLEERGFVRATPEAVKAAAELKPAADQEITNGKPGARAVAYRAPVKRQ